MNSPNALLSSPNKHCSIQYQTATAMKTTHTNRRQRARQQLTFLPLGGTAFLGHEVFPQSTNAFPRFTNHSSSVIRTKAVVADKVKQETRTPRSSPQRTSTAIVPALPKTSPPITHRSRFSPVPAAKPHEILRPARGRNSRRRTREAEYFRRYMYLRRQLKPWSDEFRTMHGRTPSLIDVHASEVPGLLDRFVEYLEALEGLRVEL